ncbi:MAG: alpha/beta hydrolase [Eubacteriales bacterium]|nr:alpha/beta hydrolase [Eubacteriales bacterium]
MNMKHKNFSFYEFMRHTPHEQTVIRFVQQTLIIIIMVLSISIYGCNGNSINTESGFSEDISETVSDTASEEVTEQSEEPDESLELYNFIINKWRECDTKPIYEYLHADLKAILAKNDFVYILEYISYIGGDLLNSDITEKATENDRDTYYTQIEFENVTVDFTLAIKDNEIIAIYRNVFFKEEFEIKISENITERYFVLENEGYMLNAVYTYVNDGKDNPTVLFISGSGLCDYNETVGLLTPFEDVASEFAKKGINSLRIDKRTLNYGNYFATTDGIEEEYLSDCKAALQYIAAQNSGGKIYLLGHSLGGQIASVIASEDNEISGMILFNSSARNLADIMYDQYSIIDPANEAIYDMYRKSAKNADDNTVEGLNYYGVSDYYWASLNKINVIENIKASGIPVLIINSTFDNQVFEADISLWLENFTDDNKVIVYIDDQISHFGYEIDTRDQNTLYKRVSFPERILNKFTNFISDER